MHIHMAPGAMIFRWWWRFCWHPSCCVCLCTYTYEYLFFTWIPSRHDREGIAARCSVISAISGYNGCERSAHISPTLAGIHRLGTCSPGSSRWKADGKWNRTRRQHSSSRKRWLAISCIWLSMAFSIIRRFEMNKYMLYIYIYTIQNIMHRLSLCLSAVIRWCVKSLF